MINKPTTKEIGNKAEGFAVEYLKKQGYSILNRNWYFNKKEIDIVCSIDDKIIFVEVKAKKERYGVQPYEAVTLKKQSFLIEAANAYIFEHNINSEARFDIISITLCEDNKKKIRHMKNAFNPNW